MRRHFLTNLLIIWAFPLIRVRYTVCQNFQLETVEAIQEPQQNTTKSPENKIIHPLNQLNYQEQKQLCQWAKEHAILHGVPLKLSFNDMMAVESFTIRYKPPADSLEDGDSDSEFLIGLKCPTVPTAVLCITQENLNENIKIVVPKNKFLNEVYDFIEEVVESVIYLAILDYNSPEDEGAVDFVYSKLGKRERWEVCLAAQNRIGQGVTLHPVDYWTEVVGMYNFVYPWGKVLTKTLAFMCNSTPRMYIRRPDLHIYSGEIFVVVLEESDINLIDETEGGAETLFHSAESSLIG